MTNAKVLMERFILDHNTRIAVVSFLADIISYANRIDCGNWNLNLDKSGNFLRFNTGQEYCVTIWDKSILVLCIKSILRRAIIDKSVDMTFVGYNHKTRTISKILHEVPNCLIKVPDSVGCEINQANIESHLPIIRSSNKAFINYAMRNTRIKPRMQNAHSTGSVNYLSNTLNRNIPNPNYTYEEAEFHKNQGRILVKTRRMTDIELLNEINNTPDSSIKVNIVTSQYVRNVYVSEFVKRQAKGVCSDCKQPAPFISRSTGEPYLETHHVVSLSSGGKDVIENVIALCPNCHRKRHHG